MIDTPKGLVVLLGCDHSGVIDTLEYVQRIAQARPIHALMGGMHLLHATEKRLAFTSNRINELDVRYLAPNHCTGLDATCCFKNQFPETFHPAHAGSRFLFDAAQH